MREQVKRFLQCVRDNEGSRRYTIIKDFVGRAKTRAEEQKRRQQAYDILFKLCEDGIIEHRLPPKGMSYHDETLHIVRDDENRAE